MPQVHTVPLTSLQQFLKGHGAPSHLHVVVDDACGDIRTTYGGYLTFISPEEAEHLRKHQAFHDRVNNVENPAVWFNDDGSPTQAADEYVAQLMAIADDVGIDYDGIIIAEPVCSTE